MRTVAQIESEIDGVIASKTALSGLTSTSAVAIYKLFRTVFAVAALSLEALWDKYKRDMEVINANAKPGTAAWIAAQVKLWQYGYALTLNPDTLTYGYDDVQPTARIATRVAVNDPGGVVVIKVAKSSGALTTGELSSLTAYMNDIKIPGQQVLIISQAADALRMHMDVYYNGTLTTTSVDTAVKAAINAYLDALPFNGELKINAIIDAIQAVPGVFDVVIKECYSTPLGGTASPVDRVDIPEAGYYSIAGYAISNVAHATNTTINYIPQ